MNAMQPTRIRLLIAILAIAAAAGWGFAHLVESWAGRVLPVPWLAAAALWILAAAVAFWALSSRPRLERRPGYRPMPPIVAARTAAMAMAASRAGALFAGGYAGVAIAMLSLMGSASGATTFWVSVAASVGAFALIAAALWLEHICRLPVEPRNGPDS